MNKINFICIAMALSILTTACKKKHDSSIEDTKDFQYVLEQFADLRILRYHVSGFDELTIKQKELIYYLSEAAKCGRDILWDQNGKFNLIIRSTLENIYQTYTGNRETDEYKHFLIYLKRVWFSNGIYHHYSTSKIMPEFPVEYFNQLIANSDKEKFPLIPGCSLDETLKILIPVIFDKDVLNKRVCLEPGKDLVINSSVNFYQNISQKEVEEYYNKKKIRNDPKPLSFGLNSRLIKQNDSIIEIVWKSGGLYSEAIDRILYWLEKARTVAENTQQKSVINKLITFYKTGDLKTWDDYNILWVKDTSRVDFVNGFIEVYGDPMGLKGSWESVVNFKDLQATKRTETIAKNAQWFEDHSPVADRFKKKKVKGVSAKVITVAMLGGDCYPYTPIGINLPNSTWIRKQYGSKSVTMENITYAYDQANLGSGFLEEFCYDSAEIELRKKYGPLASNIHTDLHECLGHGSGQLMKDVSTDNLKNYHSTIEETRADLFALYYIMDPKMIELGLLPSLDAAKVEYISYIQNGLMTQLRRIEPGENIEQAHMRNRQLIAKWCFEKGKNDTIIEQFRKDGKTYLKINDYEKLRELFGQLLIEVQRITSEGDYEAAKTLVEKYGVIVDRDLHKEVLSRFRKIDIAPYSGFVNPEYEVIKEDGKIVDIKVKYVDDFSTQMMYYSDKYSFLPITN